jgi:hypothetical protein
MKVYVLMASYNGISDVMAVFSSKEQAEDLTEGLNTIPCGAEFEFKEMIVDGNRLEVSQDLAKRISKNMLLSKKRSISHE